VRIPPRVELLEDRTLPSVDLSAGFASLDFAAANSVGDTTTAPPDSIGAAGPNYIVTAVNSDLAIYTKSGTKVAQYDLRQFFAPVSPDPSSVLSDPTVAYDELSGRFVVGILELHIGALGVDDSHLLYAVSDSSDPTADTSGPNGVPDGRAFSEMHRIRVHDDATGSFIGSFADFPRIGWNADADVFTFNLFDGFTGSFSRVEVLSIAKSTVLDANPNTFTSYTVYGSNAHFTMAPATMHNSAPGDPMWFVEEASYGSGSQLRVLKFTNLLSNSPTVAQYLLPVASYTEPPSAAQLGGTAMDTNDSRILNVEWRRFSDGSERLVAAETVGLSGDSVSHARFYEINTVGTAPSLVWQQTLNPGAGISTYFPSIAIAPNGDEAATYMQSSSSQYVSMYVTGRKAGEATLEPPALAKAGETTYSSSFGDNPYRAGDFSLTTVDPLDGSFWSVNEYAKSLSGASANWGTWVTHFTVSGSSPPPPPPPSPPQIGSLSDSPDPVKPGGTLTLTANNVTDPNGNNTVASVSFYRESNGQPGLQVGAGGDTLLGTDTNGSNGWSWTVTLASNFATGTYTYYAQARDTSALLSNIVQTTNTVRRSGGRTGSTGATPAAVLDPTFFRPGASTGAQSPAVAVPALDLEEILQRAPVDSTATSSGSPPATSPDLLLADGDARLPDDEALNALSNRLMLS
jgi:hypothetical protein